MNFRFLITFGIFAILSIFCQGVSSILKDAQLTNSTNISLNQLPKIISNKFKDQSLNLIWQNLLQLRIGNKSLNSTKEAFLYGGRMLSKSCGEDMIRAVENMAATGFYASACKLDHLHPDKVAGCFDTHTSSLQWAASMFDAWGKPPAGIASSGPFFFMGDFDQCLSVRIPLLYPNKTATNPQFDRTQYCRADIKAQDPMKDRTIPLTYGICMPQTCHEQDLNEFLDFWVNEALNPAGSLFGKGIVNLTCYKADEVIDWNQSDIIFIIILITVVSIVFTGTIVDCILYKKRSGRYSFRQVAGYDYSETASVSTYCYLPVEEFFKAVDWKCEPRMKAGKCKNYKGSIMTIMEEELSIAGAPSMALTYKGGHDLKKTFRKSSFLTDVITAFSIRKSIDHLLRESGTQIKSFHGIKVFSAVWVIIGHSFLLSIGFIGNPKKLITQIKESNYSQWIFNSSLAVDSFFLMAGAVLAFSFRRRLISALCDKTRLNRLFGVTRWIIVFFHRIFRLIPAYVIVLGGTSTIFNKIGNGPLWDQKNGVFGTKCETKNWWQHLLFIINYFPTECMPWMWYISLDMQFYVLAPFCLYLLHKVPTFGKSFLFFIILASSSYRFVIYAIYEFPSNIILRMVEKESIINEEAAQMFGLLYAAPQARLAPFFIGIFLGWILAVKQRATLKFKKSNWMIHWPIRHGARILSLILLGWSMYGNDFGIDNFWYKTIYSSQYRIVWSSGLALMVWLCERKYFEPLGAILGWNKWIPIARLCFGIYLSHELLIISSVYQRRRVWMIEGPNEIITFALGIAVLSVLCAILLAIFVELPPLILERTLFMRLRRNIALKKNDDGQLTVSEAAQSLYTLKNSRKKGQIAGSDKWEIMDSDASESLNPLPEMKSENKVLEWLEKSEQKMSSEDKTYIGSESTMLEQDIDQIYPWDKPEWISDTRIGQTNKNSVSSLKSDTKNLNFDQTKKLLSKETNFYECSDA